MVNVKDIYTEKQYECSKCHGKVFYGKVVDNDGAPFTKDGKEPNKKVGKESNVLSAKVNVLDGSVHQCFISHVEDDIRKAEELRHPKSTKKSDSVDKVEPDVIWSDIPNTSKDFIAGQEKLYHKYVQIRGLAYYFTKQEHPTLDDQSNLFGQIVYAKELILSNILIAENVK